MISVDNKLNTELSSFSHVKISTPKSMRVNTPSNKTAFVNKLDQEAGR